MCILKRYTDCTISYYTLSYYLLEYQADRYLSSARKLIACKLLDIISLISLKTIASFNMKHYLPIFLKSKSIHVIPIDYGLE